MEAYMNAEEFERERARTDVPHDDELQWDAHDAALRHRHAVISTSPPPWWCYLVTVTALIIAAVYLW